MSLMPFLMDFSDSGFCDYEFDNGFEDDFAFGVYPQDIRRACHHRAPRLQIYSARRLPYNLGKKPTNNLSAATSDDVNKTPSSSLSSSTSSSPMKLNNGDDYDNRSSYYSAIGKDGFQVCMNVQQFKPNELLVKTIDNQVIVEGKHDEREDHHGFITRQFLRKYILPKGYDSNDITATISSDGILTIKSPPPIKLMDNSERIIQIQHTGPAHLTIKENLNVMSLSTTPSSSSSSSSTTSSSKTTSTATAATNANNVIPTSNIQIPPTSVDAIPVVPAATTTTTTATNVATTTATVTPPVSATNADSTGIQKDNCEKIIKEKCENGDKCENEKIENDPIEN